MASFTDSIANLISLVVQTPHLESAWLNTLSHMEHLAAEQIMGNISKSTPKEFIPEIHNHADDEYRHRDVILNLRPHAEPLNESYRLLRQRLANIAESFVMGYFANPVLVQASSRFTAYVHGAITIEQFPFQIYSAYIDGTRDPKIRETMKQVLSEENAHIALGRKFRDSLPIEDQLSLQHLQAIEKDMCLKMVLRMTDLVQEFIDGSGKNIAELKPSSQLVAMISDRPYATYAWTYALANGEETAARHMQRIFNDRNIPQPPSMQEHVEDEIRHTQMLQRCILLDRRVYSKTEVYKKLEKSMIRASNRYLLGYFSALMKEIKEPEMLYLYGAWGLEMRVFKHYSEIQRSTDNMSLAHTIAVILNDEAEHTKMVNNNLTEKNLFDSEILKFVKQVEEEHFEKFCAQGIQLIIEAEAAGSFVPPYKLTTNSITAAPSYTSSPVMELQ
ncbi:ferritin-like domain-containing protein [Bdellovibrio bacteriovorus]